MSAEQMNSPAIPNAAPRGTGLRASLARPLAITVAVLFFISSGFPAVAGLSKNTASFPKGWGMLDVGLAFVLTLLALLMMALAEGKVNKQAVDASYRAYPTES